MYTGIRFKGYVKSMFRDDFEKIALNGEWENSNDEVLKSFGSVSRAGFIPCGSLCYMPNEWETAPYDKYKRGVPTDGFDRTWNKQTGYWTFQCSLKNYDDTIEEWFKILPYFIEKIEHLEIYYEEDDYSKQYDIINGEVKLINIELLHLTEGGEVQ